MMDIVIPVPLATSSVANAGDRPARCSGRDTLATSSEPFKNIKGMFQAYLFLSWTVSWLGMHKNDNMLK